VRARRRRPRVAGPHTRTRRRCSAYHARVSCPHRTYLASFSLLLLLLLLLLLAASACGESSSTNDTTARVATQVETASGGPAPCMGSTPVAYTHIITIVMENHSFSQVDGESPYLNSLAAKCGLAANYGNVLHPSLPNYIAMTSGGNQGITSDCTTCSTGADSIFQQVGQTGWKSFEESMPSPGYLGPTSGLYAKKHNPASYYTGIRAAYRTQTVPLGSPSAGNLVDALADGTLPSYTFVTPNMCNDEHDCSVATGDRWLQSLVPRILAGKNYQAGDTLLEIIYDENEPCCPGGIYAVMVAPSVPAGTTSTTLFTHYSLLRTNEAELGLPPLGQAATAASMQSAFNL